MLKCHSHVTPLGIPSRSDVENVASGLKKPFINISIQVCLSDGLALAFYKYLFIVVNWVEPQHSAALSAHI